jgi:hypothetical protein
MSTSRLGGDFDFDALEAFRSAYASQIMTPEDLDMDTRTGLPGNEISNTSPWVAHTGLWKANNGMNRDFVPNQPFNPGDYFTQDEEIDIANLSEEDLDAYLDSLTPEELLALQEEFGTADFEADEEEAGMSDEEIDALLAEIDAEG